MSSKGKENEAKRKTSNTGLKYGFKLPTCPRTKQTTDFILKSPDDKGPRNLIETR